MSLMLALIAVSSAAEAAPAHSGLSNCALSLAAAAPDGMGILARLFSSITEPISLVLMGFCLIGLSVVVRKSSGKRGQ